MGIRISEIIKDSNAEIGWNLAKQIYEEQGIYCLIDALENFSYLEVKDFYSPSVIESILEKKKEKSKNDIKSKINC